MASLWSGIQLDGQLCPGLTSLGQAGRWSSSGARFSQEGCFLGLCSLPRARSRDAAEAQFRIRYFRLALFTDCESHSHEPFAHGTAQKGDFGFAGSRWCLTSLLDLGAGTMVCIRTNRQWVTGSVAAGQQFWVNTESQKMANEPALGFALNALPETVGAERRPSAYTICYRRHHSAPLIKCLYPNC